MGPEAALLRAKRPENSGWSHYLALEHPERVRGPPDWAAAPRGDGIDPTTGPMAAESSWSAKAGRAKAPDNAAGSTSAAVDA
jgi:hypothetical protein